MCASNSKVVDLRSDTATKPTPAMRTAMYEAEVGDDVLGEDPSVNHLESIVAAMLGKEAALFVSSGTMGNLVSVLTHCGRGDEMILGADSHIFSSEQGGAAAMGSIQPWTVPNEPDGTIDLKRIEESIRSDNEHYPVTRLVCIENTHNSCGGTALPATYMDSIADLAHSHGLKLHVDGARLWNAAVALNSSPARLVQGADSVSVCLSKGLGAPVGSVVAGSQEFIGQARRNRKVLGGGMRQAGVIAAAGTVAVTEMVERLADDHANALLLAEGLSQLDGIEIDPSTIETNMVFFHLVRDEITPVQLSASLRELGVLVSPAGGSRLRAVLNYHVESEDIEVVLAAFRQALSGQVVAGTEGVSAY